MPLELKSLLCENGQNGTFWQSLTSAEQMRYADTSNEQQGLVGQYYYGQNFDTLQNTVVDSEISFYWGAGAPAALPGRIDDFSIRWSGYLVPETNETYTFYLGSDDGSRLYIDGQLIIDNWQNQAHNVQTATYRLRADRYYSIVVEYYESTGDASVELEWESATITRQVISGSSLRTGIEFYVYASISDWQTARERDLVALDEKEILDIRGQWSSSTPQIDLSGWTTNIESGNFIRIQALEESRPEAIFSDPALPSHFRIKSTSPTVPAITVYNMSIELVNIQAEAETHVIQASPGPSSANVVRILYCKIKNSGKTGSGINVQTSTGIVEIVSSTVENCTNGIVSSANNSGTVHIVDSTITNCITGIKTNDTDVRPTSCAVFNNDDDFADSFPNYWPRYCAADDWPFPSTSSEMIDISPVTGNTEVEDWNFAFVDFANGDYRIKNELSLLYEAGEPDLGYSFYAPRDIQYIDVGNAPRPQSDIGAFSYTDWWDYRYAGRISIEVPASEVPTDLTDFPLYIDLSKINSFSKFWRRVSTDGRDIKVVNAERERVPQELVFIDTDEKDGEIWAKVNLSSTEPSYFYVYYNFNSFSNEPDLADIVLADNIHGQHQVWSDYVAVWHLQDLEIKDSTQNGYDGTVRGTPSVVTDGRFGHSIEWNETGAGNEESADVGNIQTDSTWTELTVESWFRKDTTGDERMICKSPSTNIYEHIFALHSQTGSQRLAARVGTNQNNAFTLYGSSTFANGVWQFGSLVWSGSDDTLRLFLNGQADGTASQPGGYIAQSSQQVEIANVNNSTDNRFWEGGLDEIRIAKKRFNSYQERLETQYNNQTSEAFSQPAPQPDTNPVLPEEEDIEVEGVWNAVSANGATTLNVEITIPELSGKMALLIGITNEDNNTSQAATITLDGVSPTKAGQNRQGTWYSNTSEIWYYLNDDLPTTPGNYTVAITMSKATIGFGVTIALYDVILQTAPVYSGTSAATQTTITTNAQIVLDNVEASVVFEVASAGDSITSTISEGQEQVAEFEVGSSGARHAASLGVYFEEGTEAITRTYTASVNRLAQSILVLKSGEEKHYSYKSIAKVVVSGTPVISSVDMATEIDPTAILISSDFEYSSSPVYSYTTSGSAQVSGSSQLDSLEVYATTSATGIVVSYISDPLVDRTIEFTREYTTTAITGGQVDEADWVEVIPLVSGGITLSYESDPINDRTIIFEYTSTGKLFTLGGTSVDYVDLIFEVQIAPIVLSYESDPLNDRTIIFEYTSITEPLTLNKVVPEFNEVNLIFEAQSIPIILSYESDPLNDRTIIFEYTSTGKLFTLSGTSVDYVDLIFEVQTVPIILSYESDPLNDRTIEFERTAVVEPLITSGLISEFDEVNLIFEVDTEKAFTFGGGDYYIVFERTMSGGITLSGSVPDFDFVLIIFPTITEPLAFNGTTDENETHLPGTVESGLIVITKIFNEYNPEYSYTPIRRDSLMVMGTTTAEVTPNALFIYEPSGRAFFKIAKAEVSYSQESYYTGSGGPYFRRSYKLVEYSYYPKYEYTAITGTALILLGGEWYVGIKAIEPSGGIILNDAGDITSDEIKWDYKYKASGKIILTRRANKASISYNCLTKTKALILSGDTKEPIITKDYYYTTSGVIILRQASIHRYIASGKIITSGAFEYSNTYVYQYTTSGQLKFTRLKSEYTYSIVLPVISKAIVLSGESKEEFVLEYTASGGINFYDPDSTFKYRSFDRLRLILSGSAEISVNREYITSGNIVLKNSAHYYLLEENTHKASGTIYIGGSFEVEAYADFDTYTAHGSIQTSGITPFSVQTFDIGYTYISTSGISINGNALYTFEPTFEYVAVFFPAAITVSGSAESLSEKLYIASGSIVISGAADLTYKYDITGGLNISGTATTDILPAFRYKTSGFIKIIRIKTTSGKEKSYIAIVYKPIRLKGKSKYKTHYIYPLYNASGYITVNGNSTLYEYTRKFSYSPSGALNVSSISDYEYVIEKFYTSAGQVNIEGETQYSYNKIYDFTTSGEFLFSGDGEYIGRKDVEYIASGSLNGIGSSGASLRTIVVRIVNGTYNPKEPKRIPDEPLASRVFKYDLMR